MTLEWIVWNIHNEWQPMKAKTLEEAHQELMGHLPYSEEAKIRNVDTGEVWSWKPPTSDDGFGPF